MLTKADVVDALNVDMTAADVAESKVKDLEQRVARGEAWLKAHAVTHPQYATGRALLDQRKRELQHARAERVRLAGRFDAEVKAGVAPVGNGVAPSLNCVACGLPVQGYPALKPGSWIHLSCCTEEVTA
jgi:hypothetical protein